MLDQETREDKNNGAPSIADKLVENVLNLVETYLKVIQLEVRGSIAATLSTFLLIIIASITASFAILMLSIGVSVLLSQKLAISIYGGFFIVAGVYGLVLIALLISRKSLKKLIDSALERQIKKTEKV